MSTVPQQLDPFQKAHLDGQRAVATFLPSLTPQPPAAPPPPPRPSSPMVKEGMRAASLARHVEQTSARVARGLPPQPPQPPSPQEQFPPDLDPVHIRALSSAIAAHPEEMRAPLIHEAHENLTKWIAAKNGQIVHQGKMQIADSPKSAEQLAARIINEAVDDHDAREQAKQEAAIQGPDGTGGNEDNVRSAAPRNSVPDARRSVSDAGAGRNTQAAVRPVGSAEPTVDQQRGTQSDASQPTAADVRPSSSVGAIDANSGRIVTQPTTDLDQAQELATAAAPELKQNLKSVARQVDGANVDGVRDKKDPTRVQEKIDKEGKPVNTMTDLVAGRIAVDSPEAKEQAVAAIKGSMPVVDEDDKFQKGDPDYGFRSHTLQTGLSNGATAEVQVVPQEIADADEDTHETYERGRQAEIDGNTETAKQAMADNKDTHDQAMQEFNARNQGKSAPDIRKILEAAGIKVSGDPIKLGGHLFFGVRS